MAKRTKTHKPGPPCMVDGCDSASTKRGYCCRHYTRWLRHGDPTAGLTFRVKGPILERLLAKVDKNGPIPEYAPELGPCWIWTGAVLNKRSSHPYGQLNVSGRPNLTHRLMYEQMVGPIPDGLELDHLCRVPACCRPSHLEAVTHRENMRRSVGWPGMKARQTHCKRGHLFDEANTRIDKDGNRQCRACAHMHDLNRYR